MIKILLLHHFLKDISNVTDWIEIILLIISLIISFFAIKIALKAYNIDHAHNKVSVKPILHPRYSRSTRNLKADFYVENNGLGPLVFVKFDIKYNNKVFEHIHEVIKEIHNFIDFDSKKNKNVTIKTTHSWSLKNYSMKEGKRKIIYYIEIDKSKFESEKKALKYFKDITREFETVEFEYIFKNIYNEQIEVKTFRYADIFNDDEIE